MAGDVVFELAFDIAEKRGCAKAEQVWLKPPVPEFFLDERQVGQRILGLGNPACGLVADAVAGAVEIVADGADHHEGDRQCRIDAFLAGRGLDEVGPGHHADQRSPRDIAQRAEFAGGEDGLDMGFSAGLAKGAHLVIEGLPIAGEDMTAGDHDVDFRGPGFDAGLDFGEAQVER